MLPVGAVVAQGEEIPLRRGRVSAVEPGKLDAGFAHLAFNVDNVDAAVEASAKFGVTPISPPVPIDQGPNRGRKVVYVRDADGVTLEFIEAPVG